MRFRLILDPEKDEEIIAQVHRKSPLVDKIEALVEGDGRESYIMAYGEEEWIQLHLDQIACITILEGKTYAIDLRGERWRLKQRLYTLEEQLPDFFIRISKSALANERCLERFTVNFQGAVDAVFVSGYREYVSRRCFAAIRRRMKET